MGCPCSGSSGGSSPLNGPGPNAGSAWGPGSGGGESLEPFPRQTLLGNAAGPAEYSSPLFDSRHWKSIAWWYECFGNLPGLGGLPTAYIETAEVKNGPWLTLATQAAAGGERYTGAVSNPGSLVRVRIAVPEDEMATVAMRFVARRR
jgi:hypothetical protein